MKYISIICILCFFSSCEEYFPNGPSQALSILDEVKSRLLNHDCQDSLWISSYEWPKSQVPLKMIKTSDIIANINKSDIIIPQALKYSSLTFQLDCCNKDHYTFIQHVDERYEAHSSFTSESKLISILNDQLLLVLNQSTPFNHNYYGTLIIKYHDGKVLDLIL